MIRHRHPNVILAIRVLTDVLHYSREPVGRTELSRMARETLQELQDKGEISELQRLDASIAVYRLLNEEYNAIRQLIKRNNQTQTFRLREPTPKGMKH